MKQLRGLRTAAAFRGWLAVIARNRAIDYFREARRTPPEAPAAAAPNQGEFAILDLVRSLPEAYRESSFRGWWRA